MKYSKEFEQILSSSAFPAEWRESAIEYRRLKKLIKNVVVELEEMGLNPAVLNKLLPHDTSGEGPAWPRKELEGSETPNTEEDSADQLEFEFEADDETQGAAGPGPRSVAHMLGVVPDDLESQDELDELHVPRHAFAKRRQSSTSRRFRVRVLSNEPGAGSSGSAEDSSGPERERVVATRSDVKAEYVLAGSSDRPVPQIRLVLSSSPSNASPLENQSTRIAPRFPSSLGSTIETSDEEDAPLPPRSPPSLKKRTSPPTPRPRRAPLSPRQSPSAMTPRARLSRFDDQDTMAVPASPTLERVRQAMSPIWALTSGRRRKGLAALEDETDEDEEDEDEPELDMGELSLGEAALETTDDSSDEEGEEEVLETIASSPPEAQHGPKEYIIPLPSDVAFFNLLTQALSSLSALHASQQVQFRQSVTALCALISDNVKPPSNTQNSSRHSILTSSTSSQKDLYAWREIFTLWIEAQIFESNNERDRGERTVEAAERRLTAFAEEVVKRGLGDRRTLRGRESRKAWDEFLRLNVLLLDLKRFQAANINAARKILKKHDKRTALTASAGFPAFVRTSLEAQVDANGNVSTWTFYNTSLPHVLLASLTDTLLPILPSLDDYACLICTSIAFKPIRLACTHLFCIRCLVKMQKAGKAECPLCRSKTVLQADRHSLDLAMMGYMKQWFPKEVKEKKKENGLEVAKEEAGEMGVDARCCIM